MVKLNRRVTVQEMGSVKNDQGGLEAVILRSWEKWAHVDDRTGTNSNPYQQQVWEYDYKITMRFYDSIPTKSNYQIVYKTKVLKIESLSIDSESFHALEICKCKVVDENVITESETPTLILGEGEIGFLFGNNLISV